MTRPAIRTTAVALGLAAVVAGAPLAQDRDGTPDPDFDSEVASAATDAFIRATEKMHVEMVVDYTGNPDVDFARSMIPHNLATIDMARVAIRFGADPEIRKLAETLIAEHEAEIDRLRDWLAAKAE